MVPVLDRVYLTSKCFESVRAHTTDFELIMVDNGSTERYWDLYDQAHHVIRNRANLGFAKGCNQGAALASGDVIVFLNNDTIVHPAWHNPLERAAIEHGIAGPKLVYPDGKIQHAGVGLQVDLGVLVAWNVGDGQIDKGQHDLPRTCPAVTGACLAIRRNLFWELDGFDEGFWNGYEDVDLCLQAGGAWYEPASVVTHMAQQAPQSPERWEGVRGNVARLNDKWLDHLGGESDTD